MKRYTVPVADFFCLVAAGLRGACRARAGAALGAGAARRLCLVVVAVAVLASSLVLAGSSSAHDVFPEHSCDSGEPNDDNECVDTVEATAVYSCASGKLVGDECEIPTGADAAAVCPSGRLAGDECLHAADPSLSCGSGKLVGNRCVESVAPAQRCPTGRLAGDECVHAVDPSLSCGSGKLVGNRCVESVAPAQRCPTGRLAGDECVHAADPSLSCGSGKLVGNRCVESVAPAERCPTGKLAGNECLHSANPVYSCASGVLKGNRCVESVAPAQRCPTGRLAGDECVHAVDPSYSCASGVLKGNRCVESVAPAQRCPTGSLAGNECVHSADPVYSCGSGTLSGARCLHAASPVYSCSSGILRGARCVSTQPPVCTLNNDFAPCDTPGVTYHCPAGYTVSGGQCTRTTAAAASCPAGYQRGNFGICYKYTAASSECPAGYPPPAAGLCLKRTPAAAPCAAGYTLANGQCTRSTLASSDCPVGYPPPAAGLCLKRTPAAAPCAAGYTLTNGQCTRSTLAASDCPVGYPPPAAGLCLKRTPAAAPCAAGYTLTNGQCTRSTLAVSRCPVGYDPPAQGVCYKRTPAAAPCQPGYTLTNGQCTRSTLASSECPVGYPPPTAGLCLKRTPAAAPCAAGFALTNGLCTRSTLARSDCPADYDPPAQGVCYKRTPPEYTCTTGTPDENRKCVTTEPATLTYTCPEGAPDENNQCTTTTPAALTCNPGTPVNAKCPHTHTGPTINGLETAGTATAGTAYTDHFTVKPADATVLASGDGCALSPASSTGVYTLTATRADPGRRTCTIAAAHTIATTATATIEFTAAPHPAALAAPGGLGCAWRTQGTGRVECTWDAVAGATAGYAVEYELALNLRGFTTTVARQKTTPSAEYSIGANRYMAKAKLRVAAIGPEGRGPYTAWAAVARPGPAPRNLEVECRADARVYVSWDPATGASRYTAAVTSTPPPAPAAVSLTSTEHLAPSFPGARPPASFDFAGQPNWSYAVRLTAEASGTASLPATASASCTPVAPPAPTGVTASCANGALTVTWEPAGAGLAEATAYKPRVFTGNPPTESTNWTANAAGHDTTTAAIPGPGEPDLPDTGVFQVKVKGSNTAGDSGWSDAAEAGCARNPVSELRAVCRDDGKLGITWKVAEWYRQSAASRQFAVEIDGAHVGDEAASGQPEQAYHWDGAEVNKQHKVRLQARTLSAHSPAQYPWTARVAANKCPRFVPQNATASCNSHGVVKANWDAVNGASSYRVDWRPQHEVGSDEIRTTSEVNPSWQEDEGGIYQLAVSAYAVADSRWSDYTDPITVTCDEVVLPGSWRSPNSNEDLMLDPNSVIQYTELVTRFCPTTASGAKTVRICTENWNEVIEVRVDNQSWWQKLPLTQWSDGYSIAQNIKDLAGLFSALRGGRLPDGTYTTRAKFSVTKAGFKQGQGYAEAKADGFDYLTLSAHPPQINPPVAGQPLITGCLEPGYVYRTRVLDEITKIDGNHTTRRDITVHYCVKA